MVQIIVAQIVTTMGTLNVSADSPLAGDLFSEITMSQTANDASQDKNLSLKPSGVVLGTESLSSVFLSDQIKCEVESRNVRVRLSDLMPADTTAAKFGELRLTVDADSDRIDVVLPLPSISVGASVSGAKLMELLVELESHSNVQLIASGQTLALHSSLSNQDVTSDRLRFVAQRLVLAATNTAPVSTVIVGTWSARTSAADAWAIQFDDVKNFTLVHTSGGKNKVSRGRYEVTAGSLVLSDTAGVKLSGSLESTSEKAFRWQLHNESGQAITTLAFSKQ